MYCFNGMTCREALIFSRFVSTREDLEGHAMRLQEAIMTLEFIVFFRRKVWTEELEAFPCLKGVMSVVGVMYSRKVINIAQPCPMILGIGHSHLMNLRPRPICINLLKTNIDVSLKLITQSWKHHKIAFISYMPVNGKVG
jgi:hypothetical protein